MCIRDSIVSMLGHSVFQFLTSLSNIYTFGQSEHDTEYTFDNISNRFDDKVKFLTKYVDASVGLVTEMFYCFLVVGGTDQFAADDSLRTELAAGTIGRKEIS